VATIAHAHNFDVVRVSEAPRNHGSGRSRRAHKRVLGKASKLVSELQIEKRHYSVAALLPKLVSEGAAMYHELRKRGARRQPQEVARVPGKDALALLPGDLQRLDGGDGVANEAAP
jgi:hypothetical protein